MSGRGWYLRRVVNPMSSHRLSRRCVLGTPPSVTPLPRTHDAFPALPPVGPEQPLALMGGWETILLTPSLNVLWKDNPWRGDNRL